MVIKIWYESLPKLPKILWPIVELKLKYENSSILQRIHALVDSGASHSVLHPLVAESLGFSLKKLGVPKSGGLSVSGGYKWWILPEFVDIDIYGYSFRKKFVVIDNPDMIWPCILGEDSIFEYARIDFSKFKGYFEIKFRKDIN